MPRTPPSWIHIGIDEIQVNGLTIDGTYKILNIVAPGAVGSADSPNRRYVVDMSGAVGGGGGGGVGGGDGGSGWGAAVVRLATTGNHALTGGGTIDGTALINGDLVLAWMQSAGTENGIYEVNTSGAWTRAAAYDADPEIFPGQLIYVKAGASFGDTLFSVRNDNAVLIGTTSINIGPLQPLIDGDLNLNGGDLILNGGSIISGTSGDASAIIDFSQVNNSGILIPSLTTAERDAIGSPATGLLIWNETTNQFEYWDGSSWVAITSTSATSSGYAIVRAAATGNAPLTGPAVSDTVTLVTGDTFLCWAQTTPSQNGIYTVDTAGAWTRTVPYDTGAGIFGGLMIYVNEGATYGDKLFSVVNDTAITVGATAIAIVPMLNELDRLAFVQAATVSDHGLSGLADVDGVILSEGYPVLVANQSAPSENGVYTASSGAWSRAPGFQFNYQFPPGRQFFVNSGSKYANNMFAVNTDALVSLGSDALIIRPIQPEIDANLDFNAFDIRNVAQISLGGTTPHASAAIDFQSVNLGIGFPTVTTAERDAISSPREGLVVYNETTNTIDAYDGSAWFQIGVGSTTFLSLTDTPSSYTSAGTAFARAVPRINNAETGLEFHVTFASRLDTTERNALPAEDGDIVWNTTTAQLEVYNGSTWAAVDDGGGSTTFIALTDTPANYTSAAGKYPVVNEAGNAVVFSDLFADVDGIRLRLGGSGAVTGSASLRLDTTNGALLLNRLNTGQRDTLTPEAGMMIYNTTTSEVEGYNASAWRQGGIATGLNFAGAATIQIQDTAATSTVGTDLIVQAQSATGTGSDGGSAYFRGGIGTSDYGQAIIGHTLDNVVDTLDGDLGFFGNTPIGRPGVTGSRTSGAALVSLLAALTNLGLITNSTSS
jgi:hypothetical protein